MNKGDAESMLDGMGMLVESETQLNCSARNDFRLLLLLCSGDCGHGSEGRGQQDLWLCKYCLQINAFEWHKSQLLAVLVPTFHLQFCRRSYLPYHVVDLELDRLYS